MITLFNICKKYYDDDDPNICLLYIETIFIFNMFKNVISWDGKKHLS